jgi:parallel beta-helix repeat protein
VNGEPIGFFSYLSGDSINGADYGQLLLVSCTGVTVIGGNFRGISSDVKEGIYHDPGQASAITLVNCSGCVLDEIIFHNNTIGIMFLDSSYCGLSGGSGFYHSWTAIFLSESNDIMINDVYITDNLKGIVSGWSWGCQISDCDILNNEEAINLTFCVGSYITRNAIYANIDAITLISSDGCEAWRNAIFLNDRGLLLNSTSECVITQNNIYSNTGVGISLDETSNRNLIYNNTFTHNNPNAICEGSSNHWDNQIDTGNWWSDYLGEGPYIIDEDDQDNFPIDNRTTTQTWLEPWHVDPLLLGAAGGVVGIIFIVIIIIDRRQVRIID